MYMVKSWKHWWFFSLILEFKYSNAVNIDECCCTMLRVYVDIIWGLLLTLMRNWYMFLVWKHEMYKHRLGYSTWWNEFSFLTFSTERHSSLVAYFMLFVRTLFQKPKTLQFPLGTKNTFCYRVLYTLRGCLQQYLSELHRIFFSTLTRWKLKTKGRWEVSQKLNSVSVKEIPWS